MPQIVISAPNTHGIRWIHVQRDNGRKNLGGYEGDIRGEDTLRLALRFALEYKRQRCKRAAIVVASATPSTPFPLREA